VSKSESILKSLALHSLQCYLTDKVQLFNIVEEILNQIGTSELLITSFSISEEFIRSMYRLKRKGLISKSGLVIDSRAALKIAKVMPFACNVFDDIYLSNNHSKVLLFSNDQSHVSVCTSQNQTRGNRNESGMITTDKSVFVYYETAINDIINKAINARDILKRTIRSD
jgi:hypothetical protein